ncbi:transmembrane and coiled-coil domain-containing protein 4 isoform X4 [Callorhinchus milii]|uniref:transmembrane and coiled-coil domain-containing protein 4 isoform X4 n=1 Tax=Callorhinchus milii TaxID=7868 RepID=UPI00045739FE|nr:transmembrane and coiled-coil domain-containing protein 4 isoform X4 [Callorhinchus milii]|eukprot:gi/632983988/ref/XP_007908918.1/ PREDICTED: transmembrane and coiled-coil domain-containing protein 4 isoform X4 [Callorhinchus milii]
MAEPLGRRLTDAGRFACAGLCGVSLCSLFPGEEQSSFRTGFIRGLVGWLQLSEAVLPVMEAFASGAGEEGSHSFADLLREEMALKDAAILIPQDLVSFSLRDVCVAGYYDSRARVLIRHVSGLLQVPFEELEVYEESLVKSLKGHEAEDSEQAESSQRKASRRRLKRYFLIGLAAVGGGTVIGSFETAWRSLRQCKEQYCLAWESVYLMELGNALVTLLNGLLNMVAQEALKYTVLSGLVTALTWPASLITAANIIDNPWGVCLNRSAEVGKHLAQVLLSRQQGRRPVSLIGFSFGARVIYFCLQELAKETGSKGIIEDVVLLGAPVEGGAKAWKALTKVVAGRIVNGYCRGDWLLNFVYRSSSVQLTVAGLQPIALEDKRVINVDLSSIVNGHLDYMKQMDTILKAVGVKTKDCRLEDQRNMSGVFNSETMATEAGEVGGEKTPISCERNEMSESATCISSDRHSETTSSSQPDEDCLDTSVGSRGVTGE